MNPVQRYLRRLGLALSILSLLNLLVTLALLFKYAESVERGVALLTVATHLLPLAVGLAVLVQTQYPRWQRAAAAFAAAACVAEILLILELSGFSVDALLDLPLFLMGLCFFLLRSFSSRTEKRKMLLKKQPITLDVRIKGKDELFDPFVVAPHLEINQNLVSAVDRFLHKEDNTAPLELNIYSAEPISESLQELMIEDFRAHYAEEETRLNRFLEVRFKRSILLISIGVAALWLIKLLDLQESEGVILTIVSNYAAFSLWQVGNTYFERAAVLPDLMRAYIAGQATITFR